MLHDFGRDKFAGTFLGVYTAPTTLYIALLASFPAAYADGTDIAANESVLGRKSISTGTGDWIVSGMTIVNKNELRWDIASATVDPVVGYSLCTAATAGDVYFSTPFDTAKQVFTGGQFIVPVGGIVLTSTD